MLKKIITTVLLTSSSLGMMTANATESGLYVTGQLGYAYNGLHGAAPIISGLTPSAPGSMSTLGKPSIVSGNHLSSGIAERLALGYKLNTHTALEMGFLHLNNGNVSRSIDPVQPEDDKSIFGDVSTKQYAIDLAVKEILPVAQNFNVYGKVGIAYLNTRIQASTFASRGFGPKQVISYESTDLTQHNWAPEVAVGVSYDLTSDVSVDASITHIHPMGSNKPGNINFAAVGLGYSFG